MSITIKADKRAEQGKNAARRIRRDGNVPAVLYGAVTDSIPLTVKKRDIFGILKSETGDNTIFKVAFGDEKREVMIKEYQQDVVSDEILHVDFIQIAMDKEIRVSVPIHLVGDPVGVKSEGGFVDFSTREIEIECLPKDIPEHLEVDISDLHLHQSVKVEELDEIAGVKFITDSQAVLVLIQAPSVEEEPVEVEEEEEEIMAEGEEPEVIKKEKPEEEAKEEEQE